MSRANCLTGCPIGEVTGMTVATALGWGDITSIALAVSLAFPLFRAGLTLGAIVPIALAADTVSTAVAELVDNLTVVLVPGAHDAGLGDLRFWLPLLGGFVIAWPLAFRGQPRAHPARPWSRDRARVPLTPALPSLP